MGLIPALLGAIGAPLALTYKSFKVAFALQGARKPLLLSVADNFLSFALDINGKVVISLALLAVKFAHSKARCQRLANRAFAWIEEHRCKGATGKALEKDLDAWLGDHAVTSGLDPHTHAGLLFLRDCLARIHSASVAQFLTPNDNNSLDVRAALLALYSTPTAPRLADALTAPAGGALSTLSRLQSLIDNVYVDLQTALRRDLMDMLVL